MVLKHTVSKNPAVFLRLGEPWLSWTWCAGSCLDDAAVHQMWTTVTLLSFFLFFFLEQELKRAALGNQPIAWVREPCLFSHWTGVRSPTVSPCGVAIQHGTHLNETGAGKHRSESNVLGQGERLEKGFLFSHTHPTVHGRDKGDTERNIGQLGLWMLISTYL